VVRHDVILRAHSLRLLIVACNKCPLSVQVAGSERENGRSVVQAVSGVPYCTGCRGGGRSRRRGCQACESARTLRSEEGCVSWLLSMLPYVFCMVCKYLLRVVTPGKQLARTLRNELADMFQQSGLDLGAAFKAFDADGDGSIIFSDVLLLRVPHGLSVKWWTLQPMPLTNAPW
jgi:hypothetical protein